MIIVQRWRGTVPAGFEWTTTLAAGREHYLFGEHDSLYARCSGLSRQSLWLGQIGPPPVCTSMSMSMSMAGMIEIQLHATPTAAYHLFARVRLYQLLLLKFKNMDPILHRTVNLF